MLEFKRSGNWGWLWKYNDWCDNKALTIDWVNDSKSLCPYFWKSLWNLIVPPVVYLVVIIGMGAIFGSMFFEEPKETALPLLVVAGYTFIGTLVGLLYVYFTFCHESVVEYLDKRKSEKQKEEDKEPNLLLEWVKAKKEKVCPMIKWVD